MAWSVACLGFYEDSYYQTCLIYLLSLALDLDEVTLISLAACRSGFLWRDGYPVTTWKLET